jgi:hypothetical protein
MYSVPDLALIDLPGIVRTTTTGQDKKVIAQVESLITRYLEQERAITLAVIPVNVGMAGYLITPVLVFWTFRVRHWVKFTFETGFELPSSCVNLP